MQLLSEVGVRLQNLDHLSEVPVVVQARVLRGGGGVKGRIVQPEAPPLSAASRHGRARADRYPVLLLLRHLLFSLPIGRIPINRHQQDAGDGQKQQPTRFQLHPPSKQAGGQREAAISGSCFTPRWRKGGAAKRFLIEVTVKFTSGN